MDVVRLTKRDAAPRMLEAFEKRQLCKQRFPHMGPQYRGYEDAPCVIGVLLDDDTARRFDRGEGPGGYAAIDRLIEIGAVETDDDEFFIKAQVFHDGRLWEELETLLRDAIA